MSIELYAQTTSLWDQYIAAHTEILQDTHHDAEKNPAGAGKVYRPGNNGGYGNLVEIDHGKS